MRLQGAWRDETPEREVLLLMVIGWMKESLTLYLSYWLPSAREPCGETSILLGSAIGVLLM